MDAKIPLTKWSFLSGLKGSHANRSAFFTRQKWTLEDAYQVVSGLVDLVFVFKARVQGELT